MPDLRFEDLPEGITPEAFMEMIIGAQNGMPIDEDMLRKLIESGHVEVLQHSPEEMAEMAEMGEMAEAAEVPETIQMAPDQQSVTADKSEK